MTEICLQGKRFIIFQHISRESNEDSLAKVEVQIDPFCEMTKGECKLGEYYFRMGMGIAQTV